MKFRLGACAAVVLLAACSGEKSGSDMAALRGSAGGASSQAQVSAVHTGRSVKASIANAPDRGALMSYQNAGKPIKREGAFTYYPVAISEDHALKGVATGHMTVPMPDGSQVKLKYESHDESLDGNWTWIGRVEGGDPQQEAIITFGENAVFASIPQGAGKPPVSIQTRHGQLFAVQADASKLKSGNVAGQTDMAIPAASGGKVAAAGQVSAGAQIAQNAVAMSAPATGSNTIDVVLGYTAGLRAELGSASAAQTRMVNLVQVGNQALANSNVNGYLRLVGLVEVAYTDTNANETALQELTGSTGTTNVNIPASLAPLRALRDTNGADVALLVRNFQQPENQGCGIAWLIGANGANVTPANDAKWGYGVVSDGDDAGTDGNSYFCALESLVHEVGHLLGSAHDQAHSNAAGRYSYSYGYKNDTANFFDVMAYGDEGQIQYRIFSTPNISTCSGLPCGTAGADNARSLNQTIPVVAQFRATVVPFVGAANHDINGDGRDDLVWFNPGLSSYGYWLMNGATMTHAPNQSAAAGFTIAAQGDFTGDGRMDLVWMSPNRDVYMVPANASGGFGAGMYLGSVPAGWKIVASGDVNGDGTADLIWHNETALQYAWWLLNSSGVRQMFSASAAAGYRLAITGDFNADGRLDMIWTSSKNDLILLTGTGSSFTDSRIGNYPDAGRIFGAGDVNGDGRDDLLIRNTTNNTWGYWLMNGATVLASNGFSAAPGYTPASVGDFNGDGFVDVMWTSAASDLQLLSGNGTSFVHSPVGSYSGGWRPIDVGLAPTY